MKKYMIIGNGENTHIIKWVRALAKYYDLYLISSKTTHTDILSILPSSNVFNLKMEVSGDGGNYKILFKYSTVKKIIQAIDPEFINAHYITSHGFLAAMVKKTTSLKFKLILSAWGSDILVTPFKSILYKHLTKSILKAADLVTSDSSTMTEVIKSLCNSETMTFSFGLDALPDINPHDKEESLFFSNRILSENYRIDEVIRFFKRVSNETKDSKLIISHNGDKRSMLVQQVHDSGMDDKVNFVGFVSEQDQINLYRRSQFYISIPESDATSVSLLEAMAYGCIPIVSDIPSNHEWIIDQENGLFYKDKVTGKKEIELALKNKKSIASKNRSIIKRRAIFPDAIKKYVNRLNKL